MLRYKEKEDIEARFTEVDKTIRGWRSRIAEIPAKLRNEFSSRLKISLIYHDSALEGEVLSHSEIKAAIDPTIISDTSLIPSYEDIKYFDEACQFATQFASAKKKQLTLDVIKEIAAIMAPDEREKGSPYRKDNPLHRLYYHEIAPPEKISNRMQKFGEWLDADGARTEHPVVRAAETHIRLMRIFPWAKRSGKTARIVGNLLLQQAQYPAAIIHSIDRQRYYEALRGETSTLVSLYLEAIETTALSELQVYDEAFGASQRNLG